MIRIIVCDDDTNWLKKAARIIEEYADHEGLRVEVRTCTSPDEIMQAYDAGVEPDILFMDIEFGEHSDTPDYSGINAAGMINNIYPDCRIVYLTNYLNYAIDVYQTDHVWYVIKEQYEKRLPVVFSKIMQLNAESKAELIICGTDGRQEKIMCSSIKYLERKDRRTIIKTDDRDYTLRQRIPEIQEKLPGGKFGRCHTSFIVNLDRVSTIGDKSLWIDDGTEILISRGYGKAFRLKYMEWAKNRIVR